MVGGNKCLSYRNVWVKECFLQENIGKGLRGMQKQSKQSKKEQMNTYLICRNDLTFLIHFAANQHYELWQQQKTNK